MGYNAAEPGRPLLARSPTGMDWRRKGGAACSGMSQFWQKRNRGAGIPRGNRGEFHDEAQLLQITQHMQGRDKAGQVGKRLGG